MRAIAEFIMRGRMQATLVVAGCATLPLLYWLGAAAGCLVLLRRGLKDALGVLALGLLPALIWWFYSDDPRALLVLLGSWSLALVLRASESWNRVLLVSIAMGVVFSVVLGTVFAPQIEMLAQALIKVMPSLLGDVYQKLSVDEQAQFASLIAPVLTGLIAALLQIVSVLSLLVGRYWQALLYNPGGFGREFRAIRFPLGLAMLLLAFMLLGPNIGPQMAMLTPLCSVPLVFAGLALIHGLVAQKRLARFWLVGLYVTLLLFMQLIYPLLVVLAIVDSLIDFRGRSTPKDVDSANGEG
ncbi:hypothetical protein SAMN04490185_1595 [Pseudomonas frederiksbergensis]|jgi:hypothetical protein|uniref:Uncharacterized protein n=1 Tax=Pseudomonas frederiksbergensis TaxID=104087 RepID=A0A1P8ET12_9PSED|nr:MULTISPECIES: hypothetical protein [Pseudomonas]APV39375.1 hypothetical protein PFAS1_08475 [Pseudomonas frederiksbergensis]PMU09984.1 hypothetical protein C1Y11_14060 [Pseudomonas sp. FW305-20]PMU18862.1 hypothetical protein C1Y10_11655 [Pseudomonas sp. FW305-122]PMU41435.1 hypothetical protein C1Y12_07890 [Pseudomonas sp. FW305-47B]PMX61940.1 hypothetical protein C1Y13_10885 [Pseudomonas sp. FW305-33]